MTLWFSSDMHFGHARINELANRPFKSVEEMNRQLIDNWNSVVSPDDYVYVLGDVALGRLDDSLPLMNELHGTKALMIGNHDRVFGANKPAYIQRFRPVYAQYFVAMYDSILMPMNNHLIRMSHLPYDGDSHDEDRFTDHRPPDDGTPLLCGHVHDDWRFRNSAKGTPMFNVGVDVNNYYPVSLDIVKGWLAVVHSGRLC